MNLSVPLVSCCRLICREFYAQVDGMGTRDQVDNHFHTLWPLESISSITEEHPDDEIERILTNARDYFVIADTGIGICYYCINLSPTEETYGQVFVVIPGRGGPATVESAWGSFSEFVSALIFYDKSGPWL